MDLNCGQTLAVLAVNRVYFKDFFKFSAMLHVGIRLKINRQKLKHFNFYVKVKILLTQL